MISSIFDEPRELVAGVVLLNPATMFLTLRFPGKPGLKPGERAGFAASDFEEADTFKGAANCRIIVC